MTAEDVTQRFLEVPESHTVAADESLVHVLADERDRDRADRRSAVRPPARRGELEAQAGQLRRARQGVRQGAPTPRALRAPLQPCIRFCDGLHTDCEAHCTKDLASRATSWLQRMLRGRQPCLLDGDSVAVRMASPIPRPNPAADLIGSRVRARSASRNMATIAPRPNARSISMRTRNAARRRLRAGKGSSHSSQTVEHSS